MVEQHLQYMGAPAVQLTAPASTFALSRFSMVNSILQETVLGQPLLQQCVRCLLLLTAACSPLITHRFCMNLQFLPQVNYAQPMKIKGGDKGWSHQPVWADADEYLAEQAAEEEFSKLEKEQEDRRKQQVLQQQLQDGPDPMEALEAAAAQ